MPPEDPFEGLRLDDDFVRAGRYEPPARTRAALGRLEGRETSWRQSASPGAAQEKARRLRGARVRPVSPVFVGMVAGFAAAMGLTWVTSSRYALFVAVVLGWLVSLSLHEFAHALVAHRGGDDSVATRGYLRLDVRRYVHPLLSFALPLAYLLLGGIGLPGGAVWLEKDRLRTRRTRSLVSLAGPAANAVCAAACLVPLAFVTDFGSHTTFWATLAFLGFLQVSALVINLLPVPGLDGWGVIEPYLSARVAYLGRRVGFLGAIVAFLVLFRVAAISGPFGELLGHAVSATGAPSGLAGYGYALFRFWH